MANKHKGSNAERELLGIFTENNFRAVRVAGSGVNDNSPCDLIAGKPGKKYGVECKTTKKNVQYISKEQTNDFLVFCEIMGLEPVFAIRFNRQGWIFLKPSQMNETDKNWGIKLDEAKEKGKKFHQFFGDDKTINLKIKKEAKKKKQMMHDEEILDEIGQENVFEDKIEESCEDEKKH